MILYSILKYINGYTKTPFPIYCAIAYSSQNFYENHDGHYFKNATVPLAKPVFLLLILQCLLGIFFYFFWALGPIFGAVLASNLTCVITSVNFSYYHLQETTARLVDINTVNNYNSRLYFNTIQVLIVVIRFAHFCVLASIVIAL